MNKLFGLLQAFFIFPLGLMAYDGYEVNYDQQGGSHKLEFNLGHTSVSTVTIDGQTYSVINFEGKVTTEKSGFAELPFIHSAVMLDADKNVDMHVSGESYEDIQLEYPLLPSRGVIYRDQDPDAIPYVIDLKSLTDKWYPGNLATNTEPYILRDVRGTNVYVYPFQYNAVKNILRIYTTVNVELANNATPAINPLQEKPSIVYEMDAIYASVFINYGLNKDNLSLGEMGDILVVSTSRDETAIEPYIQWKREKGYNVSLEVVAAGTNVVGLVQDAYNNNNNLLYVQLVGDWADIKCNTLNGGTPPMDPQIGCVAGGDQVPDIAVGRFSAESPVHVTTQVNKVIAYEKTPQMGAAWYTIATGIGSNEGPGDDGEYDYEHLDVIYDNKLDSATYDTYNDIYEPGATSDDISAAVNTGTSVINYTGHGSPTSWGTTDFNNSQVANLTNGDMTPWIVSVACNNGDFHTGTCFAEAWQRHDGGGSVMFMGASISQPWDPPMRGQDYFADILTGGYDYAAYPGQNGITTTEGRTTLGAIIFNGLVLMTTESGDLSDWETAKTWNLFGDPSMQARSAAPAGLLLSNNMVMVGVPFETTVTAGGEPVEGAMVTLSHNGNYFTAITDETGTVTIVHSLIPGEALLVVTGFNTETIYETINVIPADGAYVMYAGHTVNDASANNNGMMDYGESVMLTIMLTNVGTDDALNVEAELFSADEYITLTDSVENYGNIAAGDTVYITDAFALDVAGSIPDMHNIIFSIEATGDETWVSSFNEQGHAPQLIYASYAIIDTAGNGNGKLDPGETAGLMLTINNEGSADAAGVEAFLSSSSPHITIEGSTMAYGQIASGASAGQTYTVSAASDTPPGHSADFLLDITANLGVSGSGGFFIVVGQIPVLVIDMDGNNNSATEMITCLENLSIGADVVDSWPDNMNLYSSVFVCLGVYPENYILEQSEGQELADYLNDGGNIYMEGGDTWFYDSQTPVHPMFSIAGMEDGGSDLGFILGEPASFTEGLQYIYSGDNSWIDRIEPQGEAFTIFQNQSPAYINAVAFDGGSYRTIGSSFEFGGLEDAESSKEYLMHKYLEFFGIQSIWVSLPGRPEASITAANIYPNPFTHHANISFTLDEVSNTSVEVYNTAGQLIETLINGELGSGSYSIMWNAEGATEGIYFFRIIGEDGVIIRKAVKMR